MNINFFGGDKAHGDVFIVETVAEPGYLLESHQHAHAHQSVLVSGTADVTIDGKTERMTGYRLLTIPANSAHKVVAITNIIWLCLWSGDEAPRQQAIDSLNLVVHG